MGLNNARVGLVFGSELGYCGGEYSTYGLDVVAVVKDQLEGGDRSNRWVN